MTNQQLNVSCQLIYAYLLSYKMAYKDQSIVSHEILQDKTGYSYDFIDRLIENLEDKGFISIDTKYDNNGNSYNIYSFLVIIHSLNEPASMLLESTIISAKEKELLLPIFPLLISEGIMRWDNNYIPCNFIVQHTGLHISIIKERLEGLHEKGLAFKRLNDGPFIDSEWIINFLEISFDATNNLRRECYDYYYLCRDYKLLK